MEEQDEKEMTVAYMLGLEKGKDMYRDTIHPDVAERLKAVLSDVLDLSRDAGGISLPTINRIIGQFTAKTSEEER